MPDDAEQHVTFPSNGRSAHGYLAVPESGTGPALVVIREWWGLTPHIAELTGRFAAQGWVALAPDLYGSATTHIPAEAGRLMGALPVEGGPGPGGRRRPPAGAPRRHLRPSPGTPPSSSSGPTSAD